MVSNHLKFVIPGAICSAIGGICLAFGLLFFVLTRITEYTPPFIWMIIWTVIPIGSVLLLVGIILLAKGIHEYRLYKPW